MLLAKPTEKEPEDISTLGITTIAIGLCCKPISSPALANDLTERQCTPDLSTSYMPMEENQFLYASAPVRVVLAALAGLKWLTIRGENARLYKKRNALLGILLYDGLGGLVLGWYLGTLSGKVPSYR
jgi:hypothetical protein